MANDAISRRTLGSQPGQLRARLLWWATAASVGLVLGGPGLDCPRLSRAVAQAEVTPPAIVESVDAQFPADPALAGQSAHVELIATVDAAGAVVEVTDDGEAAAGFVEAATAALRAFRFAPATQNGKPVAARIRVGFDFGPPLAVVPASGDAGVGVDAVSEPGAASPPSGPPSDPTANDAGAPAPPEPTELLAELEATVLGQRRASSRGTADFDIEVGALAAVPRGRAADMLAMAPGILLTNEGGEGHADQIFLRGFDAREGQDVEISVGGVPINESGNLHGNGYADLHFVIPELVLALRVLEGPYDPAQGNYAVAGSVGYELGLTQRGLTSKLGVGSFGARRLLISYGAKDDSVGNFVAAELMRSDGFGQNRDSARGSAMAQVEGRAGRVRYRWLSQGYGARYHSAGLIREDDFRSGRIGFFDTYDPQQGGDASRFSTAFTLASQRDALSQENTLFLVRRVMGLRENYTGFLEDPQEPIQPPHAQRGDLIDRSIDAWTLGARGFGSLHGTLLGLRQELVLGYFARGDVSSGLQQRLEAANAVPYRTDLHIEANLVNVGAYLDAHLKPTRWLTLRGGVRGDVFTYHVQDLCAAKSVAHPSQSAPPGDTSCLEQQDFGRHREANQRAQTSAITFTPRGALLLGPWAGFTLSGSYGRGIRSIDPQFITNDVATPFASADSWETGIAYQGGKTVRAALRAAAFRTHVDRDLIFSEIAGRNILGGGTSRTGGTLSARVTGPTFDALAHATFVRSRFDDTGLLIPYVPDLVARVEGTAYGALARVLGRPLRARVGAGVSYVGRRALPLGQRSNQILRVDAAAALSYSLATLELSVQNLLDARYRLGEYNYASDFRSEPLPTLVPARHFSAGAPRTVMLTFGISLGGGSA
jgi:iron complex outermembrane recepter protein